MNKSRNNDNDSKRKILKEKGGLNEKPREVKDELFEKYTFFDSNDLIQVKYEMVRRVNKDRWSIKRASKTFGFSRPSFYEARKALEKEGVTGLIPKKRGPKKPHKLSNDAMIYLEEQVDEMDCQTPKLTVQQLNAQIKKRFGVTVHTRSIYRALEKLKKKIAKKKI